MVGLISHPGLSKMVSKYHLLYRIDPTYVGHEDNWFYQYVAEGPSIADAG
jgi:hypothetical protein